MAPRNVPKIDFTAIAFPSDKLGVKYLRSLRSDRNALANPGIFNRECDTLDSMMFLERCIAQHAFENAAGIEISNELAEILYAVGGMKGAIRELQEYYLHFGLATGPASADELILKTERAGTNQAPKKPRG